MDVNIGSEMTCEIHKGSFENTLQVEIHKGNFENTLQVVYLSVY